MDILKLDDLTGQFPEGVSKPWFNEDFGQTKTVVLAVTGQGFNYKELFDYADDFKDIRADSICAQGGYHWQAGRTGLARILSRQNGGNGPR